MQDIYSRSVLFLTGLTVFSFAVMMSGSSVFEIPKDFWQWRTLIGFYLSSGVVIAACTLIKGANNKRVAFSYAGAILIDNYVFYLVWEYGWPYGIYVVLWAGVISRIPLYMILRHNIKIWLEIIKLMIRIGICKGFWVARLQELRPTRFEIEVVKIPKLAISVEFAYAMTTLLYAIAMMIPATGSVAGTITENGHFDFYYLSLIADDVVVLFMVLIFIMNIIKDNREPDTLE